MLKETRQRQITELLHENGEIEISALCRIFNVTEMTIRRDLDTLAKEEKLIRTHGGAKLAGGDVMAYAPFENRMIENAAAKEKIGACARRMLKNGMTVFFDSGTTVYSIAGGIENSMRIVGLTNGINIAMELMMRTYITAVMVGGELNKNTMAAQGDLAAENLDRFRVDAAFVGVRGMGLDGSLYVMGMNDTGLKKNIMKIADDVYIVADSTKIGRKGFVSFANAAECRGVIVDAGISPEHRALLEQQGINLIIAE